MAMAVSISGRMRCDLRFSLSLSGRRAYRFKKHSKFSTHPKKRKEKEQNFLEAIDN
jgi:hypothetical protein